MSPVYTGMGDMKYGVMCSFHYSLTVHHYPRQNVKVKVVDLYSASTRSVPRPLTCVNAEACLAGWPNGVGQVSYCCAALINEACMSVCCATFLSSELVGPACVEA